LDGETFVRGPLRKKLELTASAFVVERIDDVQYAAH
jgi:hypothetical protein